MILNKTAPVNSNGNTCESGEGRTAKKCANIDRITGFGKPKRKGKQMSQKPFQKIREAVETTGLSAYFLRNGCKSGTVPCVKSGTTYFVNVPALLKMLGAESTTLEENHG